MKFQKLLPSVLLVLLAFALAARAQERKTEDQDEPVRLKSNLVMVATSVTDSSGRPVQSLTQDSFSVFEDGVRQRIAHFASTEAPFSLLLLLDISGSTMNDLALMKSAARNFVKEIRSEDRVGLIVFSGEVELAADLTSRRDEVLKAIDEIQPPAGRDGRRFGPATGTSFYDALYLAVEDSPLKDVEGRKAIVCMSDGVDSTSKITRDEAIRLVKKSDASVYFLELNTEQAMLAGLSKLPSDTGYIVLSQTQVDRYYEENDQDSKNRMLPRSALPVPVRREIATGLYKIARRELRDVATTSGGRVFPVQTLEGLAGVYKQIAEDLRSQYLIGYYPTNNDADGRWRAIKVDVSSKGARVRARSGYRAPSS